MVKKKDIEVHVRLGKILAIGTTFVSNGSWEAIIAVTAGTLGSEGTPIDEFARNFFFF